DRRPAHLLVGGAAARVRAAADRPARRAGAGPRRVRPTHLTVGSPTVNIDRFLAEHRPAWDRLAALSRAAARDPGRLSPAELRELVKLYHRTATHLSVARTRLGDDALVARLSSL